MSDDCKSGSIFRIDSTTWIPDQLLYLYGIAIVHIDIKRRTEEKDSIYHHSFRSIFSSCVSDFHQRTGTDAAKRHFRIGGYTRCRRVY